MQRADENLYNVKLNEIGRDIEIGRDFDDKGEKEKAGWVEGEVEVQNSEMLHGRPKEAEKS